MDDKQDYTPVAEPRPDQGRMDDDELQSLVHRLIADATELVDDELSSDRAKATDYYFSRPFGNEEAGRSQFVSSDVRDGITGVTPSLLRIFFGPQHAVEYMPRRPDGVAGAAQATDFIRYSFEEENAGFLLTLEVLKDGLLKRLGAFKWGWDDTSRVHSVQAKGVTEEQLYALASDPAVTLGSWSPRGDGLVDVAFTEHEEDGRLVVWSVPPEELLFNRNARSTDEAIFLGHRMRKSRGDLLAMGISEADLEEHGGEDASLKENLEEVARNRNALVGAELDAGEANEGILYVESWPKIDVDGDGIAERRFICTIGPGHYITKNVPAEDGAPLALFTPDPEPHTLIGQSYADRLMDMQLLRSSLLRAMFDSLAASIFPRTAMVEGQVRVEDVLNTAIGAPIRMKAPGMVQEFRHDFAGREAMPVLAFTEELIERRTGRNKGAEGLDADALQSTTRDAAMAAVTASREQVEMLARVFAETTYKPLFRGLLREFIRHRPKARVVRLRGQWVEVNPETWDADMDVSVNVALGSSLVETKIATLMATAAKQESIIAQMGLSNPMVTLAQYRNTLAEILELQGKKDATRYFQAVPDNWQPPPAPPAPDPALALAQIEGQKAQNQAEQKEAELTIKLQEIQARLAMEQRHHDDQLAFDREKLAAEIELRRFEIMAQYKVKVDDQALKSDIESARLLLEHEHHETEMARENMQTEREHMREQHDLLHDAVKTGIDSAHKAAQIELEHQKLKQKATEERGVL